MVLLERVDNLKETYSISFLISHLRKTIMIWRPDLVEVDLEVQSTCQSASHQLDLVAL